MRLRRHPDFWTPLERAVYLLGGYRALGKVCAVSAMAVLKWVRNGRLPRTEWTGETRYAEKIELATRGAVTREELLSRKQ